MHEHQFSDCCQINIQSPMEEAYYNYKVHDEWDIIAKAIQHLLHMNTAHGSVYVISLSCVLSPASFPVRVQPCMRVFVCILVDYIAHAHLNRMFARCLRR